MTDHPRSTEPVSGCKCGTCEAIRKRRKTRKFLRDSGKPLKVLPHEFEAAVTKIELYYRDGMTHEAMQRASGLNQACFSDWRRRKCKSMYRASYDAVMAMEFAPDGLGSHMDPSGTIRRMQALGAAGFPTKSFLAPALDLKAGKQIYQITNSIRRTYVFHYTHDRVKAVYDKYIGVDPLDVGVDPLAKRKAITWARKNGYPPASCWDDDTIDDPMAIPEWTGKCGTAQGYRIHLREEIPTCPACKTAHNLYRNWPCLAEKLGIWSSAPDHQRGRNARK